MCDIKKSSEEPLFQNKDTNQQIKEKKSVKKEHYKNKGFIKSLGQHQSDENHIKVYKIAQTQIFIPVIFFLVKKMVKNRYCENENFSLAQDRIEVFRNHIRYKNVSV